MKSLVKRRVNTKQIALVATVLLLVTMLALQLPVNAANTFPHEYELVTVNNVDGQGINQNAEFGKNMPGAVSRDGSKVLFETTATNLPDTVAIAGATGGYLRDMIEGVTQRIDRSQSGVLADGTSDWHVMSETGRYIVFRSNATNLIDGNSYSAHYRVYVKDMLTGEVQTLTPSVDISDPNHVYTVPRSVSNDGRFIVLRTKTINQFVPGTRTHSGPQDAVLLDRLKNTWTLINQPADGIMQDAISSPTRASCDGSIIIVNSYATNLVPDYSGSSMHVYLVDIRNGYTITDITHGEGYSSGVDISCNGRYVIYNNDSGQVTRHDRLTGEQEQVSSNSDGSFSSGATGMSVTDDGDVIMRTHTYSDGLPRYGISMKHLSDDSGTLEPVQHNYRGLLYDNHSYAIASADGKYVIAASKDSSMLGIPGSQDANGNPIYNIIRIKTGL